MRQQATERKTGMRGGRLAALALALALVLAAGGCGRKPVPAKATGTGSDAEPKASGGPVTLLNVSYDPTRELYKEFNEAFAKHWLEKTGQVVTVQMSHGGSGSQARAVIDGLSADVLTLALGPDIDAVAGVTKLMPADWQGRLPDNSSPYTSTMAFLVRKGNPKGIHTWEDLVRPDVKVITPNPKTSGAARWNYLAAWGYVLRRELGGNWTALNDPARAEAATAKAREFVTALFHNVPVLDTGARGATNTFMQRGIGDVLINWENEILLGGKELDAAGFDMVIPPVSILAEPAVCLVDENARQHGATAVAQAYLEFLYSETGQRLAGKHFFRPRMAAVRQEFASQFPDLTLFTVAEAFGGWQKANATHFADGGEFDRLFQPGATPTP